MSSAGIEPIPLHFQCSVPARGNICLQDKMDCKTRNFELGYATVGSLRLYFTISQTRFKNTYSEANKMKIL